MRPLLLFLLVIGAPAVAEDAPPAFAWTYVCDGGAVLQVAYINPEDGTSLAVVGWAGQLVPMHVARSGSGARYVAFDASTGYVWHTKGEGGFLARDTDTEQVTLLSDCRRAGG